MICLKVSGKMVFLPEDSTMSSLTPSSLQNRGPAIDYSKFVWDQEKGGYPCVICGSIFKNKLNVMNHCWCLPKEWSKEEKIAYLGLVANQPSSIDKKETCISFGPVVSLLKNCCPAVFQFLKRQASKVCQFTGSFFSSHSSEKTS